MIQSKRISKQRQREIKRVEFATVEDAERFRKLVAEECLSRPTGLFFAGNPFFAPCCFRRCNSYRDPCVNMPPKHKMWGPEAEARCMDPYPGHLDRHQPQFERGAFNMKRPREPSMDLHRMSRPRHEEPMPQNYMSTTNFHLSMHPLLAASHSQNDSRHAMLNGPREPNSAHMGLSIPTMSAGSRQRFREASGIMRRPVSAFGPGPMGRSRNPFADMMAADRTDQMRRLMMNVVSSCLDRREEMIPDIPEQQIASMHKTY